MKKITRIDDVFTDWSAIHFLSTTTIKLENPKPDANEIAKQLWEQVEAEQEAKAMEHEWNQLKGI
jgi:hypothetical protein